MAIDELTEIDIEIIQRLNRIRNNTVLIEGFTEEYYQSTIARFIEYMRDRNNSFSVDFLEFINQDPLKADLRLRKSKVLFIYNIDLFGGNIDPDLATLRMGELKSIRNQGDMSQLFFARPKANLDYNSRRGYTYHDNHPLGNGYEFYRITDKVSIGPKTYFASQTFVIINNELDVRG